MPLFEPYCHNYSVAKAQIPSKIVIFAALVFSLLLARVHIHHMAVHQLFRCLIRFLAIYQQDTPILSVEKVQILDITAPQSFYISPLVLILISLKQVSK